MRAGQGGIAQSSSQPAGIFPRAFFFQNAIESGDGEGVDWRGREERIAAAQDGNDAHMARAVARDRRGKDANIAFAAVARETQEEMIGQGGTEELLLSPVGELEVEVLGGGALGNGGLRGCGEFAIRLAHLIGREECDGRSGAGRAAGGEGHGALRGHGGRAGLRRGEGLASLRDGGGAEQSKGDDCGKNAFAFHAALSVSPRGGACGSAMGRDYGVVVSRTFRKRARQGRRYFSDREASNQGYLGRRDLMAAGRRSSMRRARSAAMPPR